MSIEEANNLRAHGGILELQIKQLKDRTERAQRELENEQKGREQLDNEREAGRDSMRTAETRIWDFERQLETSRAHNEELLKKYKEANAAREKLENNATGLIIYIGHLYSGYRRSNKQRAVETAAGKG